MIPKFRAWDKLNKGMCDVANIDFMTKVVELRHDIPFYFLPFSEVVLMQSTGLKDKNGVEIYEGDIVHWLKEFISPMDMRTKHKIDSNKEVHRKESGEWGMGEVGSTLTGELFNVEVIGNIYENPELLEVAE